MSDNIPIPEVVFAQSAEIVKKSNKRLFVIVGIIIVLVIFGIILLVIQGINKKDYTNSLPIITPTEVIEKETKKTTKQLTLSTDNSKLLTGFKIMEQRPRIEIDISERAKELGWKEGYYIRIAKIGESALTDSMFIEQGISKYSTDNIGKILSGESGFKDSVGCKTNKLPVDNNGADKIEAYLVFCDNTSANGENTFYEIQFIKKDVYMYLTMSGVRTDFELLQQISKELISII